MPKANEKFGINFFRYLTNLWSIIALGLFILEFIYQNSKIASQTAAIIYIAFLTIYVSQKEYDRWVIKKTHSIKGEFFLIIWTVAVVSVVIVASLPGNNLEIPNELTGTYIALLGIYAVTLKSKSLFKIRSGQK